MPDDSSPFDDPFADLFGKLPDGRSRGTGGAASASSEPSAPTTGDPTDSVPTTDEPPAPVPTSEGLSTPAPPSRRAAREARAAGTTGGTPSDPQLPAQPTSTAGSAAADDDVPPELFWAAVAAPPASTQSLTSTSTSAPRAERPAPAPTGTLDDLFAGERTTDDIGMTPPPAERRRRRRGGWIALIVVLVLFGGAAAGGWWVWSTYEDKIREVLGWEEPQEYEAGIATGEAFLTIVSGDTGASISPKLYEAGVTKTPDAFYDYLVAEDLNPPFVPGVFRLQQQMTSAAALEAILDPANKMENTAQLREGLTVDQSIQILSDSLGIPLEDFQAAVADPGLYGVPVNQAIVAAGGQPLEGWLFPATYTFDPGVTAQQVIQTLVDRAVQSLDTAGVPVDDRERILTVASIIQREARFEADFYKVSRVIQNRLDQGMKLQMDSTAQYGYGELHDGTVSSSGEALTDNNPWNTYVIDGLPVGPIANPGDLAIDAAMHPEDGPWLYFVTVNLNTGETVFTTNYDDHLAAVEQWRQWCTDNPDAGC
jgi:UPF0755 protein